MTFVGQDLENRATTKNSQEYPPGPAHPPEVMLHNTL